MKHLNLSMMEERDAEEWAGEGEIHQVERFLSQFSQIVTNVGQVKGERVKSIIKVVNILKHFVISSEPVTTVMDRCTGERQHRQSIWWTAWCTPISQKER